MLNPPHDAGVAPLTVLYDGECPLCRREIALYRGLKSNTPVCYVDVNAADSAVPAHLTRGELLARFHVKDQSGAVHSGARAFLLLWSALPGWRWLAQLGRLPGVPWIMEGVYRVFLRLRPFIQRGARCLDRPDTGP